MNIANTFYHSALQHPNKIAIWEGKTPASYLTLHKRVSYIAQFLQEKNVQQGDRILVAIPVSIEFYATILAIMSIGGVVVLTDKVLSKQDAQYAYHSSQCKLMLTIPVLQLLQPILFRGMQCTSIPKGEATPIQPIDVNETETALITLTSGTTGKPKLANRTHQFLSIQLETLTEEMNISPQTIHCSNLPVVLLTTIASGATTIIAKKRQKHITQTVNLITCSPFYAPIFLAKNNYEPINVFIGGATILPSLAKQLKKNYPKATIRFVYGSTEAEPIAIISLADYLKEIDQCFGVPVGNIHKNLNVKIEPIHQQNSLTLGEICVQGKHVLNNYINHNNMEWVNTGDVGYFKNNKLYFLGRKKYCWIENNQFYSPLLVETLSQSIIPNQTMLMIRGKKVLFTTHHNKVETVHDRRITKRTFKFDKRHNSRINYEWLKKHL